MTDDSMQELDVELNLTADPPPFLRITGTYPEVAGRVQTIELVMDSAADGGPGGSLAGSWFTGLVDGVITAMRRGTPPAGVVLTGEGVDRYLSAQMQHMDDCNGSCGRQLPLFEGVAPAVLTVVS